MFVVVHVEPVPDLVSPWRNVLWIISGVILLLFVVFYFVFVRGEQKEAARMEDYRRKLRKRIRESGDVPSLGGKGGAVDAADAKDAGASPNA